MSTYYYALNKEGDYIFDNFPNDLKGLIEDYKESSKPFEITEDKQTKLAKMGSKKTDWGTVYTLTTESKFLNRPKLFTELLDISTIALKPLASFQKDIVMSQSSQTQEFIHNVTSLNSYSIQDLFALIPQAILSENINTQTDTVKKIIDEKPNIVAKTLLKLIKHNLAMKVEFSVFERTLKPDSSVQKMDHSARKIVLSILQIFIDDFENHRITVSLENAEKRLNVDHDSLLVSLYYIFDNSIKYCCPNSQYNIFFKEEPDCFSISFKMVSIKIQKNEVAKLSIRGYRSEFAKRLNDKGNGIGMYRILKTLKLNNAELEIIPKIDDYTRKIDHIEYEVNLFKIKFKGQQDWFKTNL